MTKAVYSATREENPRTVGTTNSAYGGNKRMGKLKTIVRECEYGRAGRVGLRGKKPHARSLFRQTVTKKRRLD